ncbi:MAG: NINE protein, partial [Firmicutes bacterium]|nr:NINE protein [Bacillota bacterium]
VGMCTYCGKPFCKDCLVEIKGKMYCKNDLDKVFDENKSAAAATATPQINITNTSSNINTNTNQNAGFPMASPKSRIVALLLCIFLGGLGAHRFYVGKVGTGILYLFTGGLFGIGWLIDFILILVGSFKDNYGRPL